MNSDKIIGFPLINGYYWYYKYGQDNPKMVEVIDHGGSKAIRMNTCIQSYWFEGEFFIGPIVAANRTPIELSSRNSQGIKQSDELQGADQQHPPSSGYLSLFEMKMLLLISHFQLSVGDPLPESIYTLASIYFDRPDTEAVSALLGNLVSNGYLTKSHCVTKKGAAFFYGYRHPEVKFFSDYTRSLRASLVLGTSPFGDNIPVSHRMDKNAFSTKSFARSAITLSAGAFCLALFLFTGYGILTGDKSTQDDLPRSLPNRVALGMTVTGQPALCGEDGNAYKPDTLYSGDGFPWKGLLKIDAMTKEIPYSYHLNGEVMLRKLDPVKCVNSHSK